MRDGVGSHPLGDKIAATKIIHAGGKTRSACGSEPLQFLGAEATRARGTKPGVVNVRRRANDVATNMLGLHVAKREIDRVSLILPERKRGAHESTHRHLRQQKPKSAQDRDGEEGGENHTFNSHP